MDYTGDVKLNSIPDGTEITFKAGTPEFDKTLETAVYISLFSKENEWYSDLIPQKIGSSINDLTASTLSNKTRIDAQEAAKKSLEWLKKTGYASEISVSSIIPDFNQLELIIEIVKPDGNTDSMEFLIPWNEMESA